MSEKKSLEEQVSKLTLASNAWIEPMRDWISFASSLCGIAKSCEPMAMKDAFSQIEGLNLFLSNKKARLLPRHFRNSPQENIWVLLRKTKEKTALSRRNSDFSPFLVGMKGLEPSRLSTLVPKTSVSTNSTTSPCDPIIK